LNFISERFSFFVFKLEYIDDGVRNHPEKLSQKLKVESDLGFKLIDSQRFWLIQQMFVLILENECIAINDLSEWMIERGHFSGEHFFFDEHGD